MKVVLLAGGFGTRISEESKLKPKPMIEIGGMPILWHIMKIYSAYGYNEFVICAGYKQNLIKDWFSRYFLYNSDLTFDFSRGDDIVVHHKEMEPWKVTIVDTGLHTMTGGRLKRVKEYLGDETFFLTYGDGVADTDVPATLAYHKEHGRLATMTAVQPEGRFGVLELDGNMVRTFREKSTIDAGWINGGFLVLEPEVIEYIQGDEIMLEREPMERIAQKGELMCYKHKGFWQCMDTMRDREKLENLWASGKAPWKVWE